MNSDRRPADHRSLLSDLPGIVRDDSGVACNAKADESRVILVSSASVAASWKTSSSAAWWPTGVLRSCVSPTAGAPSAIACASATSWLVSRGKDAHPVDRDEGGKLRVENVAATGTLRRRVCFAGSIRTGVGQG